MLGRPGDLRWPSGECIRTTACIGARRPAPRPAPLTFRQTGVTGGTDVDAAHLDTLAQFQQWAHAKENDRALSDTDLNKIIYGVRTKVLAGVGEAVLKKDRLIRCPARPPPTPPGP
jgi:hypothetical protein